MPSGIIFILTSEEIDDVISCITATMAFLWPDGRRNEVLDVLQVFKQIERLDLGCGVGGGKDHRDVFRVRLQTWPAQDGNLESPLKRLFLGISERWCFHGYWEFPVGEFWR